MTPLYIWTLWVQTSLRCFVALTKKSKAPYITTFQPHWYKLSGFFQEGLQAGDPKMANTNLMRHATRTYKWYPSNLLKGNLSRYQTLTSEHNRTESNIPFHFKGNTTESSQCLKLPGVTIDEQLNFAALCFKRTKLLAGKPENPLHLYCLCKGRSGLQ